MGIGLSKVSNRWLNRLYKIVAILLVTFAVLISSLRLLLPYAHNYRLDLQNYINNSYNSNIIIGTMHMDWQKSGPSLVANNVSILQSDAAEVFITEIKFHLDFWRSVSARNLVTKDLTLSGVKVLFDKTMLPNGEAEKNDELALIDDLTELFLQQITRFSLVDSQFIYRSEISERTFLISELNWLNRGEHHSGKGNIILNGITSNNMNLALELKGQQLSDMQGTVYLQANRLNITPWLDKVFAIKDEDTHSSINFDAWMSLEQGHFKQLQVEFGNNQIAWQHQDKIETFNLDGGQLLVEKVNNQGLIHLYSSPLLFSNNDKLWQPTTIELYSDHKQLNGYISNVNIEGLTKLYPLLASDSELTQLIEGIQPNGQASDVFWHADNDDLSLSANFANLSSQYANNIPGVTNLNGQIIFKGQQLLVDVNSDGGLVDFDKHFIQPITYQSLAATVELFFSEQGVRTEVRDINFQSPKISLSADLSISALKDQDISMALLADVNNVAAVNANFFYPHLLMGSDLVGYLNQSLQSGNISHGQVLFNGPLTAFPFNNNEGIFVAYAELTDSTFKFDPQWPAITNFAGNLNFTNNSMLITGREGLLAGIDVKGVTAAIGNLSDEQVLVVDADFSQTQAKNVANLMQASPLADSVGEVLDQVVVNDTIDGNFTLTVPLNDTDSTLAQGTVIFDNNQVVLQTPTMDFANVKGQLTFINDVITTKGLTLDWRNMPLTLDVNAQQLSEHYQTNINIGANWLHTQWIAQVPELLQNYGEGELAWQGKLVLKNTSDGDFSYQLDLDSDLASTILNLPTPFNKNVGDTRALVVKVEGDKSQSIIDVEIDKQVNFYGLLDHQKVSFSRAHLMLGNDEMLLPLNGFHITANVEDANLLEWQPFVSDIIDTVKAPIAQHDNNSEDIPLLAQPQRIRGNVLRLNVLGETIDDVSFNVLDQQAWWLLQFNSLQARGDIKFLPDWHQQGIDVDADFIHLAPNLSEPVNNQSPNESNDSEQTSLESANAVADVSQERLVTNKVFANIPPARVQCDSCKFGLLDLGNINFAVERTRPDLLSVDHFVSKRGKNNVQLAVTWQHNNEISLTNVQGKLFVDDVEQEMKKLGFASLIKDSGLEANYQLNWQGSPYQFNWETLNGEVNSELDDGYLADVSDKGARLFSVLSLQSLVRKLTLDFRDIFSDGMFYSEIKSTAQIKDGVLYTDNTKMNGSAGDLVIKGNTDLAQGLLDYRMSYKPNLTASLPVLAWIATLNPVTFIAGMAIDEVFTSKVVSEFTFELTGNLDEPLLREVNRKSKDVSVGRSTPPQIVESGNETKIDDASDRNPQLKELNMQDKSDG